VESAAGGGAADVFGAGSTAPITPAVDVKSLHAKIGALTLENDFLEERSPRRIAERKAMIDRDHDLPITKQAEVLRISRAVSTICRDRCRQPTSR